MSTDAQDQSTALAKVPDVSAMRLIPLSSIADPGRDTHAIVTNFNGRGLEAARFITNAMARPGAKLREMGNDVFHAKWFLAHVAEMVKDDGEVVAMPRTVLIAENGDTLSFVSEGGIRSMDLIRSLVGDGPWEPPLPLSVVPVTTRKGYITYRVVIGGSDDDTTETNVHSDGGKPTRPASRRKS